MARQGFRLNKGTIAKILKTVDGGKRDIGAKILAQINDPEAKIDIFVTDREVVGIVVPADKQAKNGVATKAASAVGITPGKP